MGDAACAQITTRRGRPGVFSGRTVRFLLWFLLCPLLVAACIGSMPSRGQQLEAPQIRPEGIQADDPRVLRPRPDIGRLRRRDDFPMPAVIGMTVGEAEERVRAAGSNVGATSARAIVEYREDASPAGRIIAQQQQPGQSMRPYRDDAGGVRGQVTFSVTVSRGMELAPSFLGMSVDEARRKAVAAKIDLSVAEPLADPRTRRDIVVRQDPPPDAPMQRRRVTVNPSAGYPLPDFRQRRLDAVSRDARRLGIAIRPLAEERPDVAEGIVFAQRPGPGTLLPLRGPVDLRVSRGSSLPQLVGLSLREASLLAEELGFELRTERSALPDRPRDEVADQTPRAGTRLPLNAPVRITVSDGWPTPDFLGRSERLAERLAREQRITLVRRTPREDYDTAAGLVIDQHPPPRAPLPADRRVQLTLSLGWPVAPDAIGFSARDVTRDFTARYPAARVVVEANRLSLETAGQVIAQRPAPGRRLPRDRRLVLVVAAPKPPWLWAGALLIGLIGATTLFLLFRPKPRASPQASDGGADNPEAPDGGPSDFAEEPSGIRLRLRKDFGHQSISIIDAEGGEHAAIADAVRLQLVTDSGRQKVIRMNNGEED